MSAKNLKKQPPLYKEPDRIRPTLDLTRTVAKDIFLYRTRPWDALPSVAQFIREKGHELPYDEYDEIAEDVWVHVSAYLSPNSKLEAPAIICGGARICHFSSVSGSVVGSFSCVGEHCTVKNSILFDRSKLSGHNFFSGSILGYASVIGQFSAVPDERLDGMNIAFEMPEGIYVTGRSHLGAVICDDVKIGASCIVNPGAVIDAGSKIYPLTSVSGYLYPYSTVK